MHLAFVTFFSCSLTNSNLAPIVCVFVSKSILKSRTPLSIISTPKTKVQIIICTFWHLEGYLTFPPPCFWLNFSYYLMGKLFLKLHNPRHCYLRRPLRIVWPYHKTLVNMLLFTNRALRHSIVYAHQHLTGGYIYILTTICTRIHSHGHWICIFKWSLL